MDPNSTPWSYAYNRIVPAASTSSSSEDFQHPHLAQITAANLAASFNAAAASGGSFVPPSPIASYNPTVFQQIYHHAAAASVQPKPAHYASTAVNTPHRQLQLPTTLDKQLTSFQNQAAVAAVSSAAAAVVNNAASNYYGENSSSSGASPSPTTVALTSTSLSWNAPSMISNTFLAMQQQQAQQQQQTQQQLNLVADKVQIKQECLQSKAQVKVYNDLIYLTQLQQQQQQQQIEPEAQSESIIHQQETEETYYTIDGQKYKVMRKDAHQQQPQQPQTQSLHIEQQTGSPASYPIYVSPALSSAGGSPAPTAQVTNLHSSDSITPQVIVYKAATAASAASPNKRNALNIASAGSPATSSPSVNHNNNSTSAVAYSSVIQSTLQQQHHLQQNHCWTKIEDTTDGGVNEDVKNVLQLHVKQEQRNVGYVGDSGEDVGENLIFNLPPGLEIKQTFYHPSVDASVTVLQNSQQQQLQHNQQQLLQQNNSYNNLQQQHDKSRRQHMVANMLMSPTGNQQQPQLRLQQQIDPVAAQSSSPATTATLSSQVQIIVPKEEVGKQTTKPAKTPRKRQPKKTLLVGSEYNAGRNPQELVQQQHQQHPQNQHQQQPQQQNTYYDFNNKWNTSVKIENPPSASPVATINIPTYPQHMQQQQLHTQHQQQQQPQQQQTQLPQPAHMQSSQAQSHLTNLSSYYSAFPQPITSQYTACMQQQQVYNLNQQQQSPQHQQQLQQQQQLTQQLQQQMQQKDEQAAAVEEASNKVIVPNIEEELDFLADPTTPKQGFATSAIINGRSTNSASNNTNFGIRNPYTPIHTNSETNNNVSMVLNNTGVSTQNAYIVSPDRKPIGVGTSIGEKKTQFMDSYLKFLQGERDDDPPPVVKTGRKLNYQRSPNKRNKKDIVNDEVNTASQTSTAQTSQSPAIAEGMTIGDDGHQIKILSQTQILPKKRPHAQIAAATAAAEAETLSNNSSAASVIQHPAEQIQQQQQQEDHSSSFRPYAQQQLIHQYAHQQQNCAQIVSEEGSQDPLILPPRREQCLRKAKQSSMLTILNPDVGDSQLAEPDEFADSDTDPVWTPQEEDSDDCKSYKRKTARRTKSAPRKNSYNNQNQQSEQQQHPELIQLGHHHSTQVQQLDNYNTNQDINTTTNYINSTGATSTLTVDNFKTGDFIVLRSDLVNDWPTIWQVDSKCILQKYEPFRQNGKTFYKNMSKYASWDLETKKLYLKAPVRTQMQSHTETVVEFMRSELLVDDTEQFIEKIMEEYVSYRDNFEIYIQTMISQALDPSFYSEITREKDDYFLGSVRVIDTIMENCKRKLLSITPWTRSITSSIETYPKCHVFSEWGQNNLSQKICCGCHQPGISVRFLLFGQPYNSNTMQTIPVDTRITYEKDIQLCRICAARADIFHKIAHEKHNLFLNCAHRVIEQQQEFPGKTSTEILNDLLAQHNWIDELFRNMRNSWAEVESLERQKRFRDGVSQ